MSDQISEVDKAWVTATANALEYRDETHVAAVAGDPGETTKLCMFAALVPDSHYEQYMENMTHMHDILISEHPKMVSTKPEKVN